MRRVSSTSKPDYRIIIVDDEPGIIRSLEVLMKRRGFDFVGFTDPLAAIEEIRTQPYDLLILDFIMEPIHGDQVVERIRKFNKELYILLLTGHKDLAPPLETIKALDIQGYCEKSDKFDQLLLLIESGIKSIAQMRTIKRFSEGLNSMLQAVPKIYQLQPVGSILEEILVGIMPLVNSTNAFILIDDIINFSGESDRIIFKGIGDYNVSVDDFMAKLSPDLMEHIGCARTTGQVVKLQNGVILPLINEYSQIMGVIFVESTDFKDGVRLLEIYSTQAASSINNAFLHSMVNVKNEELKKTFDSLRLSYMETIEALRLTVDAKDIYTRGHSDRVAYYAVQIGKSFGLLEKECELLRLGGIFHDIGKIGTADDILSKEGKLDDTELTEMKRHPLIGAHILAAISVFREVVPLVKCHHERIDGRGYPDGIKGDQIPFSAKILAVADAFDAMISDRHYRSRLKLDEIKKQLLEGAGSQFDAEVIEHFVKQIDGFEKMEPNPVIGKDYQTPSLSSTL